MRRHLIVAALTLSSGLGMSARTEAVPILYSQSATASGVLGTTSFSNALVTVTLAADTNNVAAANPAFPGVICNAGVATLGIQGVGTFAFTQPNGYGACFLPSVPSEGGLPTVVIAQFDNPAHDSFTHILGFGDLALAGYDLRSAFGPFTSLGGFGVSDEEFGTSAGVLVFRSGGEVVTFTATTSVPEPSSAFLFGIGALVMFTLVRRRKYS